MALSKSSTVHDVVAFLYSSVTVSDETAQEIYAQQVDGADFLDLTEEDLLKNFPKILFKERKELMKLVKSCGENPAQITTENSECLVVGYVDDEGNVVKSVSSSSDLLLAETFLTKSSLSKSLIVDPKSSSAAKPTTPRKRSHPVDEVQPMLVYDILHNQGVMGQKVIRFIKENKWISLSCQTDMLRILTDNVVAEGGTFYPSSSVKIAMAKGIVNDFPELADDDKGCFDSWYNPITTRGIIQTKFQSLRGKLHPDEKKNKARDPSLKSHPSDKSCAGPSSNRSDKPSKAGQAAKRAVHSGAESSISISVNRPSQSSLDLSPELLLELSRTRDLVPTAQNQLRVSMCLKNTFVSRRKWILSEKPTCTDILEKFCHLGSYEGRMIAQEFQMQNPLANDLVETFERWAPHIISYAKQVKPSVVESLFNEFPDTPSRDNIVAILLLPKLLPTVANSKTMKASELEHVRTYKPLLDAVVSSALVQIVPEGTNATLHFSAEAPHQEAKRKSSIVGQMIVKLANFM